MNYIPWLVQKNFFSRGKDFADGQIFLLRGNQISRRNAKTKKSVKCASCVTEFLCRYTNADLEISVYVRLQLFNIFCCFYMLVNK